ncbi:MAG: hypothetical protein KF901_09580 [Myxococcales bacterium]|nr:hypothetical protein [Myxococcales bacterium]
MTARSPTSPPRPRPRPQFELRSPLGRDVALERLRQALRASATLRGMVLPHGRVEVTVVPAAQRVWSPQLAVDVDDAPSGSVLRARFGPHPHVWTLYMALYGVCTMLAIACLVLGASQVTMGASPWGLYLTPIAAVLAGLVYGAAYVGQGLGADQMYELRRFVEDCVTVSGGPPPDAQG